MDLDKMLITGVSWVTLVIFTVDMNIQNIHKNISATNSSTGTQRKSKNNRVRWSKTQNYTQT